MHIYILHFDTKLHHAEHYIGATRYLKRRLTAHAQGHAARLTHALVKEGIEWKLASVFQCAYHGFALERKLKDQKNAHRYCSICNRIPARTPLGTRLDLSLIPFPIDSATLRKLSHATTVDMPDSAILDDADGECPKGLPLGKEEMEDNGYMGF